MYGLQNGNTGGPSPVGSGEKNWVNVRGCFVDGGARFWCDRPPSVLLSRCSISSVRLLGCSARVPLRFCPCPGPLAVTHQLVHSLHSSAFGLYRLVLALWAGHQALFRPL